MTHLVHHFLEESAERYPDKHAVFFGNTTASYQEINNSANKLANLLIAKGLGKGEPVLIVMENCVESVVSYYAILKAGASALRCRINQP